MYHKLLIALMIVVPYCVFSTMGCNHIYSKVRFYFFASAFLIACTHIEFLGRSSYIIHLHRVEGVLDFEEREHRPFQWPRVSLKSWGTLQIWIRYVIQRFDPTLETNKQTLILCLMYFGMTKQPKFHLKCKVFLAHV